MKRLIIPLLLCAISCGTEPSSEVPNPTPGPGPGPAPDKPDFQRITQIHNQYCIQCHGNSAFIRDEVALKNSSAKSRVQNGTMPPPGAPGLSREIREEYLSFFSG